MDCQRHFRNELDQWSLKPWNVILFTHHWRLIWHLPTSHGAYMERRKLQKCANKFGIFGNNINTANFCEFAKKTERNPRNTLSVEFHTVAAARTAAESGCDPRVTYRGLFQRARVYCFLHVDSMDISYASFKSIVDKVKDQNESQISIVLFLGQLSKIYRMNCVEFFFFTKLGYFH